MECNNDSIVQLVENEAEEGEWKKQIFFLHVICFFLLGSVCPTDHCQYCINPSSGIYLDMNVNWSKVYPTKYSQDP